MLFHQAENWSDEEESVEMEVVFYQGGSTYHNTYDLNDEDSDRMLKIIQRLDAIAATREALLVEERTLTEAGLEITAPYEEARRKKEEEERQRQAEAKRQQEEAESKKRKEEDEFQKGLKQTINQWQRENKCRFPGFGC